MNTERTRLRALRAQARRDLLGIIRRREAEQEARLVQTGAGAFILPEACGECGDSMASGRTLALAPGLPRVCEPCQKKQKRTHARSDSKGESE